LDFGLAKLTELNGDAREGGAAETQAGAVMGTLAYMSPEQAVGEPLDARTDVWSLGCVLYELTAGRKPFNGKSRRDTINAILSDEPEPVTESDASLPSELDHILFKALEKDRELRYQTASDLRADLKRLKREIDSSPSLNSSGRKGASARKSSSKRLVEAARTKSRGARVALAVCAVIALAAVAFVAWRLLKVERDAPDWSRASHVQLTDQAGTEFYPTLSPDGRTFVYSSNQTGNFDLYLQRVGGKNPTNLTQDSEADDKQPAFSPDGERIAFRSEREPAGLYVMEATGENVRRVTEGGFHPSWSPDGREIVYSNAGRDAPDVRNNKPSQIWAVNVESGAKRLLSDLDAMQPAWSPHGSRVAFWFMPPSVGRSASGTGVGFFSFDTNRYERLADFDVLPAWLPDSRRLIFANEGKAFVADTATKKVRELLSRPPEQIRSVAVSRDGRLLYYTLLSTESDIWLLNLE
jgi:Tol biopolymer transport system component